MKLVLYINDVRTKVWELKMPRVDKLLSAQQNFDARQDYVKTMIALAKAEYPDLQIQPFHFNIEVKAKFQPKDLYEERYPSDLNFKQKLIRPLPVYSNVTPNF